MGTPTVFVRFGGCNLRCPGWPCDTQHAIDPAYRKEWLVTPPELVYLSVLSRGEPFQRFNVCFTGGEPFLQPRAELDELTNLLLFQDNSVREVECFSNGTIRYTSNAVNNIAFIMDWKLPGSGEFMKGEVSRVWNVQRLRAKDVVKFTIKDRHDYDAAKLIWKNVRELNDQVQFYFGAVWGEQDNDELVSWVLEDGMPWKFNMQVHNYIWDRTKRGI